MEASDTDCRFDPGADIQPGDVVTIKSSSGYKTQRVVETVARSIDGQYQRATWRPISGAPQALTMADLHPVIRKAAAPVPRWPLRRRDQRGRQGAGNRSPR